MLHINHVAVRHTNFCVKVSLTRSTHVKSYSIVGGSLFFSCAPVATYKQIEDDDPCLSLDLPTLKRCHISHYCIHSAYFSACWQQDTQRTILLGGSQDDVFAFTGRHTGVPQARLLHADLDGFLYAHDAHYRCDRRRLRGMGTCFCPDPSIQSFDCFAFSGETTAGRSWAILQPAFAVSSRYSMISRSFQRPHCLPHADA